MSAPFRRLGEIAFVTIITAPAVAQSPLNANIALQPPKGVLIVEEKIRFDTGRTPAGHAERFVAASTLVFGVTQRITGILSAPVVALDKPGDNESGFGDIRLAAKFRLYRNDFGPTNTSRINLVLGTDLPSGDDPFTTDSVNPLIGGVYTLVIDRHAMHADAIWKFGTGGGQAASDTLIYDASYVYRLAPEEYGKGVLTSLFGVLELNGRYDTNGDHELVLAPGLQWSARSAIIGVNVLIPLHRKIDERFERNVGVGLTVRFRF